MRIAIVAACSSGIATTFMAAEALERAARTRGHWAKAETQGALGIDNEISPQEASSVDAVIFATDIRLAKVERFHGRPTFEVGVAEAVRRADAIIKRVEESVEK